MDTSALVVTLQDLGQWAALWGPRVLWALVVYAAVALALAMVTAAAQLLRRLPLRVGIPFLRESSRQLVWSILFSFTRYVVYTITTLLILNKLFDVTTAALITATGIIGLAIGFGTQGLVRDFVTGLFILMENAYQPGDLVEIAGQTGVVEELSIRTTRLRDVSGELRIIPNGNVGNIVNHSAGRIQARINVFLANANQLAPAKRRLTEGVERARELSEFIAGDWSISEFAAADGMPPVLQVCVPVHPFRRPLVDSLLVPVLRDSLEQGGVSLHKDRIVTYFTPAARPSEPPIHHSLLHRFQRRQGA